MEISAYGYLDRKAVINDMLVILKAEVPILFLKHSPALPSVVA